MSAAVLLFAVLWGVAARSMRPFRHQGRTAVEWLELMDPGAPDTVRNAARAAFQTMGAEALPGLESVLRERPWSLRVQLRVAWRRWRGGKPTGLPYEVRQNRAAAALILLADRPGVAIAPLTPDLEFHLTHSKMPDFQMARALARAGPDGMASLTNLLRAGTPQIRDLAGWALSQEPGARRLPGVRSALIAAAEVEGDLGMRSRMLLYLSFLEPGGDSTRLASLGLEALASPQGAVRRAAVELLGRHPTDPRVVPALRRAMADSEFSVSVAARRVLGDHAASPRP